MGTAEGPKEEGEATTISTRDSNQPQRSYLALKGFRFQVGGRSEADIQIFLDSCNKHKEDLKNIPDGKLRWANIAKSGAEASTDPENFTISHCLELGESIYFYTENQKETLKDDKTFIDLCDQIKDFKEHLLTPLIKNNAKQSQPGKMEKEILPENKMEEIIAVAKQYLSLFNIKGCDKVHVWREVSKKVNIKNADKYLQDNIKSKIINELKNEDDPELKKEKFLKLAQPIIDIFDFIAPRTYKVISYVPDFKQENEEMRKTNDPEPVIAEGPPEMILPENASAKNHEDNPKKIKNVKRKSTETPEKNDEVEQEEEFIVNYEPPIKKFRKKKSREVFISGWLNDDVSLFIDACIENVDQLKHGKQWGRWKSVSESCRHIAKNPDCFTNGNCSALAYAFKKKFESQKHLMEQEGREHWKELYDKAQIIWDYLDTDLNKRPEEDEDENEKEPVKKKRGRPPKPVNDVEPDTTCQNEEKETQVHKKQRKRQAFSKIKNVETPKEVDLQEEPSSSRKQLRSNARRKAKKFTTPKTKKDQVDSTTPIMITDVRSLCPEKIIETPETSEACETDTETIETKTTESPSTSNLPRVRFAPNSQSSPESLDEPQKVSEIRTGFQENAGPETNPNLHTAASMNQFPHTPATSGTNQFITPAATLNQFPHASTMNQLPHTPATSGTNQFNTPASLNQFPHMARNQFPHTPPTANQFPHPGTSANHPENLKPPNTPMSEMNHPMHQIPPNQMPVFPPNFMHPYDMVNQYYMNPYQNNFMNQPGPSRMPIHPPNAGFANTPDQMAVVPSHRGGEEEIPIWFKQYAQCRDIDHWKFIQLFHQKNEFLKIEKEKVNNLKKILDKLDVLNQDS